jgi:hypothetical protein
VLLPAWVEHELSREYSMIILENSLLYMQLSLKENNRQYELMDLVIFIKKYAACKQWLSMKVILETVYWQCTFKNQQQQQ